MPNTAGYVPNPGLAYGQPDAVPGPSQLTSWPLTEMRGTIAVATDLSTYTQTGAGGATQILGCTIQTTAGLQPLMAEVMTNVFNNTSADACQVSISVNGANILPVALSSSAAANAINTIHLVAPVPQQVAGTILYITVFLISSPTTGTASTLGSAFGGTMLRVWEQ